MTQYFVIHSTSTRYESSNQVDNIVLHGSSLRPDSDLTGTKKTHKAHAYIFGRRENLPSGEINPDRFESFNLSSEPDIRKESEGFVYQVWGYDRLDVSATKMEDISSLERTAERNFQLSQTTISKPFVEDRPLASDVVVDQGTINLIDGRRRDQILQNSSNREVIERLGIELPEVLDDNREFFRLNPTVAAGEYPDDTKFLIQKSRFATNADSELIGSMVHVEVSQRAGNIPSTSDEPPSTAQYVILAQEYIRAAMARGEILQLLTHTEVDRGIAGGNRDPVLFDWGKFYIALEYEFNKSYDPEDPRLDFLTSTGLKGKLASQFESISNFWYDPVRNVENLASDENIWPPRTRGDDGLSNRQNTLYTEYSTHDSETISKKVEFINEIIKFYSNYDETYSFGQSQCFLAGTQISMWPITDVDGNGEFWTKAIEHIRVNDFVVSTDKSGNLVPGRVTRVFESHANFILDFFGTFVTPGHAYYCVGGHFSGRYLPLIDILRSDGAIQTLEGEKLRASTNALVGSVEDQLILAMAQDGQPSKIRAGTRHLMPDGTVITPLDVIKRQGWKIDQNGLIVQSKGAVGEPFPWSFTKQLPKPEDYILALSDLRIEDLYVAPWEGEHSPQMPPPYHGEVGESFFRDRVVDPNIPLSLHSSTLLELITTSSAQTLEGDQVSAYRIKSERYSVERPWKIYNFEVAQYHNYNADGIHVHNDSIISFIRPLSEDSAETADDFVLSLSNDVDDALVMRDTDNDGQLDRIVILDGFDFEEREDTIRLHEHHFILNESLEIPGDDIDVDDEIAELFSEEGLRDYKLVLSLLLDDPVLSKAPLDSPLEDNPDTEIDETGGLEEGGNDLRDLLLNYGGFSHKFLGYDQDALRETIPVDTSDGEGAFDWLVGETGGSSTRPLSVAACNHLG